MSVAKFHAYSFTKLTSEDEPQLLAGAGGVY